jgi:predicted nucleic acid-binding protein
LLVIDASVALPACGSPSGFEIFADEILVAPPLLWSECRSALHEALWRKQISMAQALRSVQALEESPIRSRTHAELGATAWDIADQLGWARTYDAEYVALARLLECRLVTLDGRLRRGADRLGLVVTPSEL